MASSVGQADLRRVEDELSRLGLGDVEQVVDQGEQRARRVPDQADLVQLLGPSPPSGSASSRVSPMIEFSGVRSSWLTLAQNLFLDSDASAQLLGLLVKLPVERDHAPVGLLEFVRQLAVQGHHAAVGLLQLGVEQQRAVPSAA